MNEIKELDTEQEELNGPPKKPSQIPNLLYILIAAVLLIVIVVAAILLITRGRKARGIEQYFVVCRILVCRCLRG